MLELGMSGSVRGVSSNGHPYRDPGSKAAESARADPCTECVCRLGRWISAEPIEDEADNLFSNCLGFTRFLRPEVGNWCAFGLRR